MLADNALEILEIDVLGSLNFLALSCPPSLPLLAGYLSLLTRCCRGPKNAIMFLGEVGVGVGETWEGDICECHWGTVVKQDICLEFGEREKQRKVVLIRILN